MASKNFFPDHVSAVLLQRAAAPSAASISIDGGGRQFRHLVARPKWWFRNYSNWGGAAAAAAASFLAPDPPQMRTRGPGFLDKSCCCCRRGAGRKSSSKVGWASSLFWAFRNPLGRSKRKLAMNNCDKNGRSDFMRLRFASKITCMIMSMKTIQTSNKQN